MPSIPEMIRQELQSAKNFLLAQRPDFALQEVEHAILLLSIIHKKERGPMSEAEGAAWYRKMAVEGDDDYSRAIFRKIAEEEEAHIDWVEKHGNHLLRNKGRAANTQPSTKDSKA